MADNIELLPGTGGAILATDDVGGVHYQITKLAYGALDTATIVSTANRLPVALTGTLTVDGSGVTQPVSGTVELGATSLAALESLTTISTVTTVGAVTAITNALPVGANVIGAVTQSGNWSSRTQDGAGNALTSAARGSERALTVQIVDASGNQVTSFSGSGTASAVSTANSTTATLLSGAVFTGTSEDISAYASVTIAVISNVASATDGLSIQQSPDGSNWDLADVYTVPAATGKTFGVQVAAKFYRVVYTNGGTNQASFRLQSIFHTIMPNASSVRPQDARTNDNDMTEVISYLAGFNGTTWDRLRTIGTGVLSINVNAINAVTPLMGAGVTGTGSQRVTIATDGQGQVADNAAFTDTATRLDMAGYIFDEVAGTALTENDAAAARINVNRAQVFTLEDSATRGQRQAVSAAGAASINVAQVNGNTALAGNGVTGTGSPRVTIASDNTAFSVNAIPTPQTSGGYSISHLVSAATTNATNIKASAGQVFGWYIYNSNAAARKVAFHNTAGTPTAGTGVVFAIVVPPGSAANVFTDTGIAFATGIAITTVTDLTDAGATAVALNDLVINVLFK